MIIFHLLFIMYFEAEIDVKLSLRLGLKLTLGQFKLHAVWLSKACCKEGSTSANEAMV